VREFQVFTHMFIYSFVWIHWLDCSCTSSIYQCYLCCIDDNVHCNIAHILHLRWHHYFPSNNLLESACGRLAIYVGSLENVSSVHLLSCTVIILIVSVCLIHNILKIV
jgi:hypothetical protein